MMSKPIEQPNVKLIQADLILHNGKIAAFDAGQQFVLAVAIKDGRFTATGTDQEMMAYRGDKTKVINLGRRTVIPGLNDSHTHVIRGGLNYNMELRWDGVPSLADALRMLREQAQRTPAPQWVRVVGSWSEFQFAERRMPTLDELNDAAPDTPVFVLHLYARALLNRAALQAVGYTKDTPPPPGGEIQRDSKGNLTGMLVAKPNAFILYATLNNGPKLSREDQLNSSRQFMRELNRLGVTSVIDAGGGFQNYPDDYTIIEELNRQNKLTVRFAYNLYPQRQKHEIEDFSRWNQLTKPGQGNDFYRVNGAGEMLVFSAADFEDFLEPRPDLAAEMEMELKDAVKLLAQNRWPFRLHATYNESITRFLNVFEEVNREVPFNGLRWFFDHAETISSRNIERVRALGGGIAVQDRMAFQGEYFINRYGAKAAEQTPPITKMLEMGIPVGGGTDATRVSSYNPWVAIYWLVTGKTVGGTSVYQKTNRLERIQALHLYTVGSAWFSSEEGKKGSVAAGQLADLAVLSADYFSVPEEQIKGLESVLTIVGGKVVYAGNGFESLSPPPLPVSPDWSPVAVYGGHSRSAPNTFEQVKATGHLHTANCFASHSGKQIWAPQISGPWGLGCNCFVF
jgi:predicted amidohydrolase YtcJ